MSVFISTRKRRIITAFVIAALLAGMVHFTTPHLTAEEQAILDNVIVSSETFSDSILGFDLTDDEVVVPKQGDSDNTSAVPDTTDTTYVNSGSVSYSSSQFLSYNANTGVYNVDLSASRAAKYIDRLAVSSEYRTFYNSLIEAADNDGNNDYLIDTTNPNALISGDGGSSYGIHIITHSFADASANDIEAQIAANTAAVNKIGRAVYDAFDRDHPEVFWLSGDTKIRHTINMTTAASGLCKAEVRYYLVTNEDSFDIRSTKYRDVSAIKNDIANLNSSVNSIIASLSGADLGTKVAQIDQILCAKNSYNNAAASSGSKSYPRAYESISGLVYHNGNDGPVCEGYARGFKVICDRLGVPCVLSSGLANDGSGTDNHMWNLVQINGAWYGVDSTWNDKGDSSSRQYTLKGSSSFLNHRTVRNDVSQGGVYFTNEPAMSSSNYVESAGTNANNTDTNNTQISTDGQPTANEQTIADNSQVANLSSYEFILTDNNNQQPALNITNESGIYLSGQEAKSIEFINKNNTLTPSIAYLHYFTNTQATEVSPANMIVTAADDSIADPANYYVSYSYVNMEDSSKTGMGLPVLVGKYTVTVTVNGTSNTGTKIDPTVATTTLEIAYPPFNESYIMYNGSYTKLNGYSTNVSISASGYTVATSVNGAYNTEAFINKPYSTDTGLTQASGTFYFKNQYGQISAPVTCHCYFDVVPPTGSITLGTKTWQTWLSNWTSGRYKVRENEVTITANDNVGIKSIQYCFDTTKTRYSTGSQIPYAWLNYSNYNKPTVPIDQDVVIYAKIEDTCGNVTYINSDGMVLDTIAPVISNITITPSVGTAATTPVTTPAGTTTTPQGYSNMMVTFDIDSSGSYYYMILPSTYTAPNTAASIVATYDSRLPGAVGGTVRYDYSAKGAGSVNSPGTVTFFIDGLTEGADYRLYLVACDDVMTDWSVSKTRNDAVNVSTIYPSNLFKYNYSDATSNTNKLDFGGTVTVNEKCNVGKTGTYDLAQILPAGAVLGTPVISADGFRIFSDSPKLAGTVLSYTLYPDANNNGKTGIIRIPVTTSTSFKPYDINLYVTATNLNYNMIKEEGISYVPSGLASIYSTTENLVYNLKSRLAMKDNSIAADDMKIYNITLLCTGTDGIQHVATAADFPSSGLVVTLAYPTGTSRTGTNFTVAHMFEDDVNGYKAGDIEFPTVTNTENGIQFVIHGLSPIIVGWRGIGGGINYQELQPADSVTIQNNDPTVTYALSKVEGFINVPNALKALYADATIFNKALTSTVMAKNPAINANNVKLYDVKLCTIDAKGNKKQVTYDKIPNGGVLVTLAYPPGTSKDGYTFTVAHMFEETYGGHKPGDVEFLSVTNASYGMQFRVTSLSPIVVGWVYTGTTNNNIPNANNGTTTVIAGNGTNKPTGNRVSPATGELYPWDRSILEK